MWGFNLIANHLMLLPCSKTMPTQRETLHPLCFPPLFSRYLGAPHLQTPLPGWLSQLPHPASWLALLAHLSQVALEGLVSSSLQNLIFLIWMAFDHHLLLPPLLWQHQWVALCWPWLCLTQPGTFVRCLTCWSFYCVLWTFPSSLLALHLGRWLLLLLRRTRLVMSMLLH